LARRVIFPERLSRFAKAAGPGDEFLSISRDGGHEDVFGETGLLSDTIVPGDLVLSSFLEPDRFGHWVMGSISLARSVRWVGVIARHHRDFTPYGFLGCLRYLRDVGAEVSCVIPEVDQRMIPYYSSGHLGFEKHGLAPVVIRPSDPPEAVVLSRRPVVSRGTPCETTHGIEDVEGVKGEVLSSYRETAESWVGLPCSIPFQHLSSVASLIEWFRPTAVLDLGTLGYGSASFLRSVSGHLGSLLVVIEEDSHATRTFEKRFLASSLCDRSVSARILPRSGQGGAIASLFDEDEGTLRLAVVVDDLGLVPEVSLATKRYQQVLIVPRFPMSDATRVVTALEASSRPSTHVTIRSGRPAVLLGVDS
jgi:hypothetical protein